MAGKGKKKSKDSNGNKEKKKGGKKKGGRNAGASSAGKSSKIQGDIFSEGAMENAYLLCHNVQVEFILFRSDWNYLDFEQIPGCVKSSRFSLAGS